MQLIDCRIDQVTAILSRPARPRIVCEREIDARAPVRSRRGILVILESRPYCLFRRARVSVCERKRSAQALASSRLGVGYIVIGLYVAYHFASFIIPAATRV